MKSFLSSVICFLIFQLLSVTFTTAQPSQQTSFLKKVSPRFVENKGQVVDQNGRLRPDIKYIYTAPGFKLILKENSFSYELYTAKKKDGSRKISEATGRPVNEMLPAKYREPEEVTFYTSRIDIELKDANPHPELIAEEKTKDFQNYYLAHTPQSGITNVYSYSRITYRNIYPHIDFVFYTSENGKLKYDIIVHPGGRLGDVKMYYKGMNGLGVEDGKLQLVTNEGSVKEEIPRSYLLKNYEEQKISYSVKDNTVSFDGEYLSGQTLVIDPVLSWASYYGGSGSESVYSVSTDDSGNVYIAGATSSTTGISSTGAYQTTYGGSFQDAFLVKFSSTGARKWATYYGGAADDVGYSIALNTSGVLYLAGYTSSTNGISTSGTYQTTRAGTSYNNDAFLAKFNRGTGARTWGTYFGGKKQEGCSSAALDASGNIYITGGTSSDSGIATSGSFQDTLRSTGDAYLAKFNSSGNLVWATYYGGNSVQQGRALATDTINNVYLTCWSTCTSGVTTSGAYQTTFGGGSYDGLLVKFNSSGQRQWATYFGGSKDDYGESVVTDKSGNVYLAGETQSSTGIATSGAYQTSKGATDEDAFLAKFNSSGKLQWATYYGGSNDDACWQLTSDIFGNLFLAGYTVSSSGIATAGAYKTTLSTGGFDAYLAKFSNTGKRLWASYYGGNSDDLGYATATDASGNAYIAGQTQSTSGIATTGAFKTSGGGTYTDGFLTKFNAIPEDAALRSVMFPKNNGCGRVIDSLKINVRNNGDNLLSTVKVGYSINGKFIRTVNLALSVIPLDSSGYTGFDTASFTPGTYSLKVWISNPNGRADADHTNDTLSYRIIIYTKPVAGFTVSKLSSCQGDTFAFSNTSSISTGSISSLWDFGDGSTSVSVSPKHAFSKGGTYSVKLTVTSDKGCIDSIRKIITVYPRPVAGFTVFNHCFDTITSLVNTSTISSGTMSYLWEVWVPGFNSYFTYTVANPVDYMGWGLISVKLTVKSGNGCIDSIRKSFTIYPQSQPGFTIKSSTCLADSIRFSDRSGIDPGYKIASYKWDFGDNTSDTGRSPVHKYSKAGDYTVKLTLKSNKGCTNSTSNTIHVYPVPKAGFLADSVCEGEPTLFFNKSTGSKNYPSLYNFWDFGDGSTSLADTPVHIYKTYGIYQVKLTTSNFPGCKDSVVKAVKVYERPYATISTINVCQNKEASFSMAFPMKTDTINRYEWDFGDGQTSIEKSPRHKYARPGIFKVKLRLTSSRACMDSSVHSITIYPAPIPDFSFNEMCVGSTIQFRNLNQSSAYSYHWDFGDGQTSTLENPAHLYAAADSYKVSLTVTNANGCQDSLHKTVHIFPLPKASFTVNAACAGTIVHFENTSIVSGKDSLTTFLWKFGNGATSADSNPVYTYPQGGVYTVTLVTVSNKGCADSFKQNLTVYPSPKAVININSACLDSPAKFSFTLNDKTISVVSRLWTFGDGSKSTAQTPTHPYSKAGNYTIWLKLQSDKGCVDSLSKSITVYALPDSQFTATKIKYRDYSFRPVDTLQSKYLWQFGDGDTSSLIHPVHTYKADGSYKVRLAVMNRNGCVASSSQAVVVNTLGVLPSGEIRKVVRVYPNPFEESFVVEREGKGEAIIEVFDMAGQRIAVTVSVMPRTEISLGSFAAGMYLLRVKEEKNVFTNRIIKE